MRVRHILLASALALSAIGCPASDSAPPDAAPDVTTDTAAPDTDGDAVVDSSPDLPAPDSEVGDDTTPDPIDAIDATGDTAPDHAADGGPPDVAPEVTPKCGNGIEESGEECDDGDGNSDELPDACRTDCSAARCGDGVTDSDEGCDDANSNDFDGCTALCEAVPVVPVPAEGEIVITELMINPSASSDPYGEWIEIINTSDEDLFLGPCVLRDEGTDVIALDDDGTGTPVSLSAGQRMLLGFSASAAENGGIMPDVVYSTMLLDNLADEVIIECEDVVVDQVAYNTATWPMVSGGALSLDPPMTTAADNDVSFSWCPAVTTFGDGDTGTPGAANDACPPPDVTIDACELWTSDAAATAFVARPLELVVRFLEAGITDASSGNDAHPDVWAEVGFGPDASDPAQSSSWTWSAAAPIAGWDDADGWDGHQGAIVSELEGTIDAAARVTRDGGATWTYCDRVSDDDVYSAPDALQVVVVADPCATASCDVPPDDYCDADLLTLQSHPAVGSCVPTGPDLFDCLYEPLPINCGDQGVGCSAGICQGVVAPPTVEGEVVFNEIMIQPSIDDYLGEWFEMRNTSSTALNLAGCSLADEGTDLHVVLDDVILGSGDVAVVGRTANPVINGGVDFDYVVDDDIVLNTSDALVLTCGATMIDAVVWTNSWPHTSGVAMALSPYVELATAGVDNDDALRWCEATVLYGQGEVGSPGSANSPCLGDEVPVKSCTLEGPATVTLQAGVSTTTAALVVQNGITDQTTFTDPDPSLLLQAAFGPDGSDPAVDSGWTWVDAQPDLGWDAATQGGPTSLDRYVASVRPPPPGEWDLAFRASADGGHTWTLCDRDGNGNGYSPSQSVNVTSEASACAPDPCGPTPESLCVGDLVSAPVTDAMCELDATDAALCWWPSTPLEDCTVYGAICDAGACTGFPVQPLPGEVLISELMVAPLAGSDGEWIELYNPTETTFNLAGCALTSGGGAQSWEIPGDLTDPSLVWPGATYVVARSASAVTDYDRLFEGIALSNTGDTVALACGAGTVNAVTYDTSWPVVADQTMALSGPWAAGGDNSDPTYWCAGGTGTPNAANPTCGAPDGVIDSCMLAGPLNVQLDAGALIAVGAVVYDAGVTDATSGVDTASVPGFVAQVGYGPVGVHPATDVDWSWAAATPTDGWDDAGIPGWDGWSSEWAASDVGTFDVAARVSLDEGQTWLYCDSDGSDNGYDTAQAGQLEVSATACVPNPCTSPPAPSCDNGDILISDAVGQCAVGPGGAECSYPETAFDCSAYGGCAGGTCADLVAPAAPGDLVVTEIMANSADAGVDDGEFLELYNPTANAFELRGCTLSDSGSDNHTILSAAPVIIAPSGYALLVANADESSNGGLAPTDVTYVYSDVVMGNVVDELVVTCGAAAIDTVAWTVGWPLSEGVSMSLSSALLTASDNDDAASWCEGAVSYGDGTNKGTPGTSNESCGL